MYYIAQILGILATVCCLINPFFKKKWQMLVNTAVMNLFFALNFFMLNNFAFGSAVLMNIVAIIQTAVSYIHTTRNTKVTKTESIIFSVLYIGCGFWGLLNATGYAPFESPVKTVLELLPIIGAVFNMIAIFVRDEQSTRKFTLANASVWSVYTAILLSTSFFAEIIAVITTSVALFKYRKRDDKNTNA